MPRTTPAPITEAPGNFNTSALFNAQVTALNQYLLAPPVFFGYQTSSQAVTSGSFVAATLDTERVDSDGGHSTVTNTSRYTFQVAGWYLAFGVATWTVSSTGTRATKFLLNGSTSIISSEQLHLPANVASSSASSWAFVQASVGDYIEMHIYQNSGGALSTNTGADWCTSMGLFWISN